MGRLEFSAHQFIIQFRSKIFKWSITTDWCIIDLSLYGCTSMGNLKPLNHKMISGRLRASDFKEALSVMTNPT